MMECVELSETSVRICETTRHHNCEDRSRNSRQVLDLFCVFFADDYDLAGFTLYLLRRGFQFQF
jgi:hypothetical protein